MLHLTFVTLVCYTWATMENKCLLCSTTLKNSRSKFCSPAHKMQFRRKGTVTPTVTSNTQVEAKLPENDTVTPRNFQQYLEENNISTGFRKVEFVSTGIQEIDEFDGGFPRRRVTELFGMQGVGKTTLCLRILNANPDLKVLYVDVEDSLADAPQGVTIINETILEKIQDVVQRALDSKEYDLIIVDSVATMIPKAEDEGNPGEAHVGLKARLMSQWMRRIVSHLRESNTALVFINQQREKISSWGPIKFTPGGNALLFASSLRLELRLKKADIHEKYQLVEVVVAKSRFGRPMRKTEFKLYY